MFGLLTFGYQFLKEWPTVFSGTAVGTTIYAMASDGAGSTIATGGAWAVAGSIVTVLAVQGFKFLGERSNNNRQSTIQLAEIAARREAVLFNVLQTAIDRKTEEKHSVSNAMAHALLILQEVKDGAMKPEDIDLERLVARAEFASKPKPVAPIAIPSL